MKIVLGFAGFLLILIAILTAFTAGDGGAPVKTARKTAAQEGDKARQNVEDNAVSACNTWSEEHSKIAMGEIVRMGPVENRRLPRDHFQVAIIWRSKGEGYLMRTTCEYVYDGKNPGRLINARSAAE